MYLSRLCYIHGSAKYYTENSCQNCHTQPAVMLSADCNGDAEVRCKSCWKVWFDTEIARAFNTDLSETYKEAFDNKYKEYGKLYELKPKSY